MDAYSRGELTFDVTDAGPTDGAVVILLHGFPQNRHCWDEIVAPLTDAGYRVLAPDQRGYSPRARPAGRRSYVVAELVEDVLALVEATGADRVHLVGHDWGAFVAWAFASKYPERLRTVTPISVPHPAAFAYAFPRGQALRSWYMALFQLPLLPERLLRSAPAARVLGGRPPVVERMRGYLDRLGADGLTAALNWYRAMLVARPSSDYAHRCAVPTMHIWSDGDPALGRVGAEATGRYVTGPYRFEVLHGVTHWIPEEVPDRLVTLLREQLAAHP